MTSNDNLYREIMPSDKLPTKNGDYICILKSDNSGYDPRVSKVEWWNNSDSHRDYWLGSVQCWLEKIEADQQDLWDDVKIAFAKDIAAILSGVNSEPVNVNEIISKYFLIPQTINPKT